MNSIHGRVRLRGFAALAVPSMAGALMLGVGITQGLVSAAVSSAAGFELTAPTVDSSRLALTLGSSGVSSDVSSASTSATESAIARLSGATLASGMCVGSNQKFPVLGDIGLSITTPGAVQADTLDLSAASLDLGNADLPATIIGAPNSTTDAKDIPGTQPGGFSLQARSGSGQGVKLTNVSAHAYGATLGKGLKLTSLKIVPKLFTSSDAKVCG